MNIGIDIRSLMDPMRTGVGEYTYELLEALFKIDTENQYFLFYNSSHDVSQNLPKWKQANVYFIGFNYPNKLLNFSLLFLRHPHLDKMIIKKVNKFGLLGKGKSLQKLDYFFSPNINFLSLSKKQHLLQGHLIGSNLLYVGLNSVATSG